MTNFSDKHFLRGQIFPPYQILHFEFRNFDFRFEFSDLKNLATKIISQFLKLFQKHFWHETFFFDDYLSEKKRMALKKIYFKDKSWHFKIP